MPTVTDECRELDDFEKFLLEVRKEQLPMPRTEGSTEESDTMPQGVPPDCREAPEHDLRYPEIPDMSCVPVCPGFTRPVK
jgi:hypothetical protein